MSIGSPGVYVSALDSKLSGLGRISSPRCEEICTPASCSDLSHPGDKPEESLMQKRPDIPSCMRSARTAWRPILGCLFSVRAELLDQLAACADSGSDELLRPPVSVTRFVQALASACSCRRHPPLTSNQLRAGPPTCQWLGLTRTARSLVLYSYPQLDWYTR